MGERQKSRTDSERKLHGMAHFLPPLYEHYIEGRGQTWTDGDSLLVQLLKLSNKPNDPC